MAERENLDDAIIGSPGSVFEIEDVTDQTRRLEEEYLSDPQNGVETDLGDTSLPTDVAMETAPNSSAEKSAEKSKISEAEKSSENEQSSEIEESNETEKSETEKSSVSVETQTEDKEVEFPRFIWSKKGYNVPAINTSAFGSHYHQALQELLFAHRQFSEKRGNYGGKKKVEPPSMRFSRMQEVMRASKEAYEKLTEALFLDRDIRFSETEFEVVSRSEKRKREARALSQNSGPAVKRGYYTTQGYERLVEKSSQERTGRSTTRAASSSATARRPPSPEQLRHPRRRHPTPGPHDEPLTEVEVSNYAIANQWNLDDKEIFLRRQAEAFERRDQSRNAPVASPSNSRASRAVAERIKGSVVREAISQAMQTVDWESIGAQMGSKPVKESIATENRRPPPVFGPSTSSSSGSESNKKEKFVIPRRPRK